MNLIGKYILKNENKWFWFIITILGSFIPIFFRFLVSLAYSNTAAFDIKDLLFAGLAMNLSNFNLISSKHFKAKTIIALLSAAAIGFIAVLTTIFLTKENLCNQNLTILQLLSGIFVFASIFMSYETNNFVLNKK